MTKKMFKTESQRVMDLMINSIYTNKEIFLRELISNASDAIDKVYYKALTDESVVFDKSNYYIRLSVDRENRTVTIEDTGIGMTADELDENLGTIAKSGSHEFKTGQEMEDGYDIIGQFGVGFYASFMVAKKVEVDTLALGSDRPSHWVSEGADGYSISAGTRTSHGTTITLHLRENSEDENYDEYLDPYLLRSLVEHYSNYIRYPIIMLMEKQRPTGGPSEAEPEAEVTYETYYEDVTLNAMVPIWRKNRNELTPEDYNNFYQAQRFGFDEPLFHTHMSIEGMTSFKAILYIPGQAPFDYYTKEYEKGLELYANGVLIMKKCGDLLPDYFGFVKGVVDSEDLSLNISREMLQQDRQVQRIKKTIEDRISKELKNMMDNDRATYNTFFASFGNQMKMGVYDYYGANKDKLQDFLLFYSAAKGELISFQEYVAAMPESQKYIYYATGNAHAAIDKLPQVSIVRENGYDVLYLTEHLDEFVLKGMRSYADKEFRNVSGSDLGLISSDDAAETTTANTEEEDLLDKMKALLQGEVVNVKTTTHLKDDLVYLSTEGEISIDMEKTLQAMPTGRGMKADKVLEINRNHPVYNKLQTLLSTDEEQFALYTTLLYDQARLIAGLPIEDPISFTQSISKLMA